MESNAQARDREVNESEQPRVLRPVAKKPDGTNGKLIGIGALCVTLVVLVTLVVVHVTNSKKPTTASLLTSVPIVVPHDAATPKAAATATPKHVAEAKPTAPAIPAGMIAFEGAEAIDGKHIAAAPGMVPFFVDCPQKLLVLPDEKTKGAPYKIGCGSKADELRHPVVQIHRKQ